MPQAVDARRSSRSAASEERAAPPTSRAPDGRQRSRAPSAARCRPSSSRSLPRSPTSPPTGERWVHEIKFDGYRLLARIDRGRVQAQDPQRPRLDHQVPIPEEGAGGAAGRHGVPRRRGGGGDRAGHAELRRPAGRPERRAAATASATTCSTSCISTASTSRGASLLERKAALRRLLGGHDGILTLQRAFRRARRRRARARLPPGPGGHRLQARDRALPLRAAPSRGSSRSASTAHEFVIIGYVPSTTQRRAVGSLVLGYSRQGQARLCRPRRLGLLERGGRGPVAPAGGDPRCERRRSTSRRRPRCGATCAG